MVGRFISGSLGHGVISTEIKATFAGCIDYGNLIHGDIDALTVFESVKLLPFDLTIMDERNCYSESVTATTDQLFL